MPNFDQKCLNFTKTQCLISTKPSKLCMLTSFAPNSILNHNENTSCKYCLFTTSLLIFDTVILEKSQRNEILEKSQRNEIMVSTENNPT